MRRADNTNSPSARVVTIVGNHSHHVCVPCLLAAATIQGRRLFVQELRIVRLLFEGGDCSRAAFIRRNTVYRARVQRRLEASIL